MGFLNKLKGGKDATQQPSPQAEENVSCGHGTLIPRWDRAEDMGKEDRITSYTCESCGASLSPAEAREVQAKEEERLRV